MEGIKSEKFYKNIKMLTKVIQIYQKLKELVGWKKWNKCKFKKKKKRKNKKIREKIISWMISNVLGINMHICLIIKHKVRKIIQKTLMTKVRQYIMILLLKRTLLKKRMILRNWKTFLSREARVRLIKVLIIY